MSEQDQELGTVIPDLRNIPPVTEDFTAGAGWRKASSSVGNGACVEASSAGGAVMVRDSADPSGPVVAFPASAWRGFLYRLPACRSLPAAPPAKGDTA